MVIVLYIFFQIVGESFPISSSGHVAFLQNVYYFLFPHAARLSVPMWFDYVLHVSTVCIVLYYFSEKFLHYIYDLVKRPRALLPVVRAVVLTDLITAVSYIGKEYVQSVFPLWLGFGVTGCALYSLRYLSMSNRASSLEELSLKNIVMIACAQCISVLPGISRFGLTFVAARWQGLSNVDSFFYSFLIALPLFGAASLKGIIFALKSSNHLVCGYSWDVLGASIVLATLVSYYAFIQVGVLIRTNRLWYVSYYMFVISMIVAMFSLLV